MKNKMSTPHVKNCKLNKQLSCVDSYTLDILSQLLLRQYYCETFETHKVIELNVTFKHECSVCVSVRLEYDVINERHLLKS